MTISSHRPPLRIRRAVVESEISGEVTSAILWLIASGRAINRADIARALGLAPSTVTGKVNELLSARLVADVGIGAPTGGRRARVLQVMPDAGCIAVADLGRNHARLALLDLSGALLKTRSVKIDIRLGAVPTLTVIAEALHLLHRSMGDVKLRGVGVSLPGPVDTSRGCADSPAAMPGWHDFNVTGWLTAEFGVIAVADNDANMMALGEHTFRSMRDFNAMSRQRSMLFLKAGASIGCGIILNGHVYRGSTALAGDIAHVKVAAAADRPCSCGNSGCLETIAGGVALVADLRAFGFDVTETADVVRLINNANLAATTQSRVAGRLVGDTMSAIINFFNPDLVVLGGLLGAVDPFAAALRAQLYECCHPLATRMLQIEQTAAGENSGVLGVGQLCLREILTIV